MDLNILWFILITVLYIGFFFLEGFDYGVGIVLPFLGKNDEERRRIINTIGPFWDGNEVWLLTAGGATFAAFPNWYATLFSGFYLPLFLILLALIVRGVAFEFRSKDKSPTWRNTWDWMLFIGSFIPALLWGVALANILRGVPIDQNMEYVGGFFNLLNPYALLGGLVSLSLFTLHGSLFLSLKSDTDIAERARNLSIKIGPLTGILMFLFVIFTYFATDIFTREGINPGAVPILAGLSILLAGWFVRKGMMGWGFVLTGLTIVFTTITFFMGMFPRVMISSLNPEWSLTIYNASSTPYTLKVMSIVALIFVPIVLFYQGWTYYVFRKRVTKNSHLEY
ncbi:MAG: cytochrome d ubiquinol oxidase subunit II [Calditrichia bacterium]